jgi:hypothetical protein
VSGKFKFEPRSTAWTRDDVNQVNKQFDAIESAIAVAAKSGPSVPAPAPPAPPITNVLTLSGVGGAAGSVSSGVTVTTDGTTIDGDGGATPISLITPVALSSGGLGIDQVATQQITTLGTLIGAGTAQAQPPIAIPGVLPTSAAAWSLPNVPDATWQTGITVILVCGTNQVTPYLVNPTAAGITPIAQLINIKVIL